MKTESKMSEEPKDSGFKTDSLNFNSKPFGKVEVKGFEVELRLCSSGKGSWITAYAKLPNSKFLTDSFLSHPTFREEDWVGVDTGHSWNEKQTQGEQVLDAIWQIGWTIDRYNEAIKRD